MIRKHHLASLLAVSGALGEKLMPDGPSHIPKCDAKFFSPPNIGPGVAVTSIVAKEQRNHTVSGTTHHIPDVDGLNFCQVQAHLSHDGSNDKVLVEVWLPLSIDDWNGRFQATGGAGFATGMFGTMLGPAVKNGYAASSTDGGHNGEDIDDLSWALKANGEVDLDLLHTFATRSLAEQIILGKSITEQFYGEKPRYSYWNGCSQGGRQGYEIAQKYPHLLDGILATAPAISLTHLVMGDFWPQLVMKEAGIWMSNCEFDFFRRKAMEECDMLDGISDGVITDPDICDFDPLHVVGQTFYCDDKEIEVTMAMATVLRRIEEGPRTPLKGQVWHGLPQGTNMRYLGAITMTPEGARTPVPFPISSTFFQTLLLRQLSFNVTKLTYGDYMALWAQASYEYGWLLDADEPDLTRLQESGAKLLTWHGINDPVIPYQNTVRYRERVEKVMRGAQNVDSFYRLFLAPGVEHCGGGVGPVPKDALAALIEWVEHGEPPETLEAATTNAEGELVTRDVCSWPGKTKYMGIGDAKRASSWSCVGGTERPEAESDPSQESQNQFAKAPGRAGQILGGLKERLEGLGMGLSIG